MFITAVSENFYKTHGNQRSKNLLLSCHLLQEKVTSPWTYTKTNPTEEAPGTGAKGSNEYYFVGYLIKGHGNGRSFQGRMNTKTGSQSAVTPAGQKPCWKFIHSCSLQDASLGPGSFAAIFVVHSPSSHPGVWCMWLSPVLRHSMGLSVSSPKSSNKA